MPRAARSTKAAVSSVRPIGFVEHFKEAIRDADGREFVERVRRIEALGVYGGDGGRKFIRNGVVVEDDDFEAERVRVGDFGDGTDPAVGGDQEMGALVTQLLHGAEVQTVALREPVRDVVDAVGAERLQALVEDGDGRDAVDVEVAEERDGFVCRRWLCGRGRWPRACPGSSSGS